MSWLLYEAAWVRSQDTGFGWWFAKARDVLLIEVRREWVDESVVVSWIAKRACFSGNVVVTTVVTTILSDV